MSYQNLNLDRDKILQTLKLTGGNVTGPVSKGAEIHFHISFSNENEALLVFYYKKDGTTTISTSRGGNKERSEELAKIILEQCLISNKDNISLYIKDINNTDFNDAIEYLTKECGAKLGAESDINGGKQYQYIGRHGDKLTVKFFHKNQAMQVQGKPLFLYADLVEILCELLPYEKIVKPQFEAIKIECTTSEILNELQAALPNSYSFLYEKTRAIISPSLALRRVSIELEDYTAFVMPALRGLEAYVKQLFLFKGVTVDSHKGFGEYLTGAKPAKLNTNTISALGCPNVSAAIEKSYDYWSRQRHGLFHVDSVVSTTRIISRKEADEILSNVLHIIEESYALI